METKEILKTNDENPVVKKRRFGERKIKLKTVLRATILIVVLICGFTIGVMLGGSSLSPVTDNEIINLTPDIDVAYLNTALKEASELTTAKLRINGLVDFKDTGIIILNRSDFTMRYTAEISAGIDVSKVVISNDDVDHENKKIVVKIPKATVFKPNVYHGDEYIKFYDEKFALYNVNEKEDLSKALALAEDDAKKEAVNSGLLKLADKQSEVLIKGILSDALSPTGYSVEIKYIK